MDCYRILVAVCSPLRGNHRLSSYSDVCKDATIKTLAKPNNDLNLFKENARRINEKQKTMLKQRLTRQTLSTLSFRRIAENAKKQ